MPRPAGGEPDVGAAGRNGDGDAIDGALDADGHRVVGEHPAVVVQAVQRACLPAGRVEVLRSAAAVPGQSGR